jgi:hypothetical protein
MRAALALVLLAGCAHAGLPRGTDAVPAPGGVAGELCAETTRPEPAVLATLAREIGRGYEVDGASFALLFPIVGLDPDFAPRVRVRAPETRVCGGVLWARDLAAEPLDASGAPVEAAVATKVAPGPVLAVDAAGVQVEEVPAWRIVGRAELRRYGWVPVAGVAAEGVAASR